MFYMWGSRGPDQLTGSSKISDQADWESESVSHSVEWDSATPWTVAHQAPLSMGFSRQEYSSG